VSAAPKSSLPAVLAEIAEVAGAEAAWALMSACGGTRVFIPAEPVADHWLTSLVGPEAAAKLCRHFRAGDTGQELLIPIGRLGEQRRRLYSALEAGQSAPAAARAAGMHERTAYRARKRLRDDDDQGELF
jgi:hypothetical protein